MAGSPQFPKLRTGGDASRTQDNISQQVAPIAAAVRQTPMLDGTLPGWVALSPLNGFASTAVSGLGVISYHKDALGYTHLTGRATHAAGAGANTALAQLPQGARPRFQQRLVIRHNGAGVQSIFVDADGFIYVEAGVAAGGNLDLSGSFLADG